LVASSAVFWISNLEIIPHTPAFSRKNAEASEYKELALHSWRKQREEKRKSEGVPPPYPTILHEYQRKRLTEIAIRN